MLLPNGVRYALSGVLVGGTNLKPWKTPKNAVHTQLSTRKIEKGTADRLSSGPSETVVQLGSPCPLCSSPNSWKVLKTVY